MTQELVKISSPRALSVAPEEIATMQEAFAMNIGNGIPSWGQILGVVNSSRGSLEPRRN